MVRLDSDHVNWVLVVILVTLALLLAMTQSTGEPGALSRAVLTPDRAGPVLAPPLVLGLQARKEARTPSELWAAGCAEYQAGQFARGVEFFEHVAGLWPEDLGVKMWAGMAAHRGGDASAAIRHWQAAWSEEDCHFGVGVWPAIALAAAYLETGRPDEAARFVLPLERGDFGPSPATHPVGCFYAALVYEQLAYAAPQYRDAVEESLAERFSPALAWSDATQMVSPSSKSWLIFLTKRALLEAIRGAQSIDWAAPMVPGSTTREPSLAPTVVELLECLGSADFASQARRKLRALELYQSPPSRGPEIFDDPGLFERGRLIAARRHGLDAGEKGGLAF